MREIKVEKRYRDENGHLTMSLEDLKKATLPEAMEYYKRGHIYYSATDGREYVYLIPVPEDGELAHFQSFDGFNLFIPLESLGAFLPAVASAGNELIFVE